MELLIVLALGFGVLYLMTGRTRKMQKEASNFRNELAPGHEVMTGSGLFGTVVDVQGDIITLETSPGVTSRWLRAAIAKPVTPPEDEATDEELEDDVEYEDEYDDEYDDDAEYDDDEYDDDDAEYDEDEPEEDVEPATGADVTASGSTASGSTTSGSTAIEVPDDASSLTGDEDDRR
jgi:preprotein translocase subunit YajC